MELNLTPNSAPLEIWGGIEGTINRVGDSYYDQCLKNGHRKRGGDLEKIREIGITQLRYPFLWELSDWEWFDRQAESLQKLGINPIAGLIHHGSGPIDTDLMDPEFPEKFAAYAEAFSKRYPWIQDYTPVNEPLTTARFSGLYGVWYPHAKSDREFLRALFHETKATILAMKAIRKTNPNARLIQTDDMGRASGTPKLQYQVDFENERRWLGFDLLCGMVKPGHKLYDYLIKHGLSAEELKWIRSNACPPDVIGINHYLLSSRFLDEEPHHYGNEFLSGNGRHTYADVGAVNSPRAQMPEASSILLEAWERYRLPIAITEVHVHGARESQLRWFKHMWNAALEAREKGADVRAVTAWSVLGSFDWNSLCTKNNYYYESGVFDVRSGELRPTALAKLITKLSKEAKFDHALYDRDGWWVKNSNAKNEKSRPILITGGRGTLAQAFARVCEERNLHYRLLSRQEMDITQFDQIKSKVDELNPWAIINAAGYVKVDQAEQEAEKCFLENLAGAENLARVCAEKKVSFLTFSSDLVFDGKSEEPYLELDPVSPLNVYGKSKAEAEKQVLALYPSALVIRTSSFFGPWDEANFVTHILKRVSSGETVEAANDTIISPTYVPDLAHASLDLLLDEECGIIHLTNEGSMTWAELAQTALKIAPIDLDADLVVSKSVADLALPAKRPQNSAMSSTRAKLLPSVDDALVRYFKELKALNLKPLEGIYE